MAGMYESLNEIHLDVLKEIGNIGAGHAATALSTMLSQKVDMTVPQISIKSFDEVAAALGGHEKLTVGVLVNLEGDVNGMVMFLLDKDFAHLILNVLLGMDYHDFDELGEMEVSAIKEIGNILTASYVNSIAQMTGLTIDLSIPSLAIDMAGALLSFPIIQFGSVGDQLLSIAESFVSESASVHSHMILFAEIDSLKKIMNCLGIEL